MKPNAVYLVATGLNHKTAPLELRETVSLEGGEIAPILEGICALGADEGAVLSTCNRTEVYLVSETEAHARDSAFAVFENLVGARRKTHLEQALYYFRDGEAARHLFTVAGGLDSLVIGEAQVLGQVREAHRQAASAGTAGPVLSQLFNQAAHVGKRVRTETRIGEGAASVSYAAVELAKKIFEDLSEKTILLVGAGKMAELAAKNLSDQGAPQILVANRTEAHSHQLAAAVGGRAVRFDGLDDLLPEVDIVITSTGARQPLLSRAAVQRALRQRRGHPLFIIDIAVPRDVDPAVHRLDGVFLYNIDDLKSVVEANLAQRRQYIADAQRLADEEAGRFEMWLNERVAAPVIKALRGKVKATADREVSRVLRRLAHLPEREKEEVRALARAIAGKLLHDPTLKLKSAVDEGTHPEVFRVISELFDLEVEGSDTAAQTGGRGNEDGNKECARGFRLPRAKEGPAW